MENLYYNHLTMHKMENPNQWMNFVLGWYFGYPICCIEEGLKRKSAADIDHSQKIASEIEGKYSGYIPCSRCASYINFEGKGPGIAIRNRKCPIPFPDRQMGKIPEGLGMGKFVQSIFDEDGYTEMYVKGTMTGENTRAVHLEHTIKVDNDY